MTIKQGFKQGDYWSRYTLVEDMPAIRPLAHKTDEWVARAYREIYIQLSNTLRRLSSVRNWRDFRRDLDGFIGVLLRKMKDTDTTAMKAIANYSEAFK